MDQKKNSNLASVTSKSRNKFLHNFIKKKGKRKGVSVWIGGHDRTGKWKWESGSKLKYKNWGKNQPNKKYKKKGFVRMSSGNGKWYSHPKTKKYGFICQYPI